MNLAGLREQAIANAGKTEKTASYRVSAAVLAFLSKGLRLRLEPSTTFTGVKSGSTLRVSLSAPELSLGLPGGIPQPRFSRTTMIIDPATGAVTLSSSAPDGTLRVGIPDARATVLASGAGVSSDVTLRVPVLGQTASLSGHLSYPAAGGGAAAELSGRLSAGVRLGNDAELGKGATVTLSTAGGLDVAGAATLGRPGHQLGVRLAGAGTGKGSWTFRVSGGDGGSLTPLPGLTLARELAGSLTVSRGIARFDVHGRTARPWSPLSRVSVSGAVEFSDEIPNDRMVPAPGLSSATPWAAVNGTVMLAAGHARTETEPGIVAVNLATGKAIVTGERQAGFRGDLLITPTATSGSVRLLSVPAGRPAVTAPRSGEKTSSRAAASANSGTGTTTYTLSSAVYSFLTGTLHLPLGSATLSGLLSGQTLTVGVSVPTALPSSLPGWIPNPSYTSAAIVVDEASDSLTLTASTGTTGGLGGTLTVTIAGASSSALTDGTDVTGSLALTGVPFTGGSAAELTFTLGYNGSALSVSLTGSLTSAATFASGVVTIPAGTTIGLATGTGLAVNGTANIAAGSNSATIGVSGTLTDLSNWSLTVSDAHAPVWQPATGLSVTPDFSGTISDTAGSVGFDLASASSGPFAQWVSPDSNSTVSVCGFELSNQAPSGKTVTCAGQPGQPGQATCGTAQVRSAGDLWIGIVGSYAYAPANISLNATGCFDLTARAATVSTAATGDLTSEFGGSLPFSVTQASLTATVTSAGKFSLTGSATATITKGVSGNPFTTIALSLSNAGIVAGGQISLGSAGLPGSGTGTLYVSTATVANFDPSTLGLSGTVIPSLPAGLTVSFSYAIPDNVTTALQHVIPGFPASSVTAMASLSLTGFSIDAGVVLGTGQATGGLRLTPAGTSGGLYLDRLDLGLSVGENTSVSISGTGYVQLPALVAGSSPSAFSITVGAEFNVTEGSLLLSFNVANGPTGYVQNVLGIQGFNVQDFGGSIGVVPDNPSLQLYADNIVLPGTWSQAIGMVNGSQVSFNANISMTQPVLMVSIQGPSAQQPALTPLAVDPNLKPSQVQSFTVSRALFELAPFGGTDPGTGASIPAGVAVIFDASLASVPVHVDASVDLTALSVSASVSVGSFWVGPVQVQNAYMFLSLSPTSGAYGISGGVTYGSDVFTASFGFAVGTSADGASARLLVKAGLPNYFQAGATLIGLVSFNGASSSISASGYGYLSAGGSRLGPVNIYLSMPGSLSWQDVLDSITQVAQFFENAGFSVSQIVPILGQFGYSTWNILNALGSLGQYGQVILSSLASAFGFSTTYYDIWTYTSAGQLLVLDVSGGSTAPNASVDTWTLNVPNSYNQNWEFVQSPYPGWYEIVSRNSGQCLSVYNNSTAATAPLVQYPCFGGWDQLWYMGNVNLATTYVITSALDGQVVDVQSAYPWRGGTVDQYPYNGGGNQQFWLTNSPN
jgi:hypothetical protein